MGRLIKKAQTMEFYHGTSSDKVDSILAAGLAVFDGGQGDGAYVTSNFDEAKKYAIKRAGVKKQASTKPQFQKYENVYPIVLVIKIDENQLKKGYANNYFSETGIEPQNISQTIDVSDDQIWQALLDYLNTGNIESAMSYTDYVATIV